jgi:hypothetical protein
MSYSYEEIKSFYDNGSVYPSEFSFEANMTISSLEFSMRNQSFFEKRKTKKKIEDIRNMMGLYKTVFCRRLQKLKMEYLQKGYAKEISDNLVRVIKYYLDRIPLNDYLGEMSFFIVCDPDGICLQSPSSLRNRLENDSVYEVISEDNFEWVCDEFIGYGKLGEISEQINDSIDYPGNEDFCFSFIKNRALIEAVSQQFRTDSLRLPFSDQFRYFIVINEIENKSYSTELSHSGRTEVWVRVGTTQREKNDEYIDEEKGITFGLDKHSDISSSDKALLIIDDINNREEQEYIMTDEEVETFLMLVDSYVTDNQCK